MSGPSRRVSVGFDGGQVLSVRVAEKPLRDLEAALAGGSGGWHEIAGEDQTVRLDLSRVLYVCLDADEAHVGFG
ncbi:MAG TPA: hypothetical protein VMA83_05675 [Solirubrobacteraceae bacterium]|nr:hypothetical protein [Solirubrobacteraceae bacterium]